MSNNVEELFGEAGSGGARPRRGWIIGTLVAGLLLALFGLVCSSVPGGALVLASWYLAQRELDRVDSGFLPLEFRPGLLTLRALVWSGLLLIVGLFILQGLLLWAGAYDLLWTSIVEQIGRWVLPGDFVIPPGPAPTGPPAPPPPPPPGTPLFAPSTPDPAPPPP